MKLLKQLWLEITEVFEILDRKYKINYRVSFWLPFVLVGVITILVIIEGVGAYNWNGSPVWTIGG